MSKGRLYPAESSNLLDERTGVAIRQVTSTPAIHHQPFFMIPAYDDAMQWTIFASERTGAPQIFAEVRATGELLQLTDRADLSDWSIHPSHDGRYVYFTAGTGGWRVNTSTFEEEQLIDLGDVTLREKGMVAAAMGTTALSADDRWWAIKFNVGSDACLSITNTQTGKSEIILRRDTIAHLQFCPDDPSLLFYAGPLNDRVWVIQRDGTGNRRLYQRQPHEWITHESWIPGGRELEEIRVEHLGCDVTAVPEAVRDRRHRVLHRLPPFRIRAEEHDPARVVVKAGVIESADYAVHGAQKAAALDLLADALEGQPEELVTDAHDYVVGTRDSGHILRLRQATGHARLDQTVDLVHGQVARDGMV